MIDSNAPTVLVPKKPIEKIWHKQQAKILRDWAEIASSYRWMHYQAYMRYKKSNMWYMIPLIIMSTVTGTANFAQTSFPVAIRSNIPQIIGAINLFSAILTTIYQFLKISEFMESHRISAINYGKLARTITVELNIPVKDRATGGAECVKQIRGEIDRLIEQSPTIPKHVLYDYEHLFSNRGLCEPEIIVINKVDIYDDPDNKPVSLLPKPHKKHPVLSPSSSSRFTPVNRDKETTNVEMETLSRSRLVSSLAGLFSSRKKRYSEERQPIPPSFPPEPEIEEGYILPRISTIPGPSPKAQSEEVSQTQSSEISRDVSDDLEMSRTSSDPQDQTDDQNL
jgi:hypothetical protein